MADVPTVEMSGPLGPFAAGFVDDMRRQGFGPVAVRKHTGLVAGLSGWLMAEDVALSGFLSVVRGRGAVLRGAARSWSHVSADHQGARSSVGVSARAGCRAAGESVGVRGAGRGVAVSLPAVSGAGAWLGPGGRSGNVDKVRPFVARFDGPDGLEFWRADVAEVRGFVVDVCPPDSGSDQRS